MATTGGFDMTARESENGDVLRLRIPPNPRFSKRVRDDVVAYATARGVRLRDIEDFMFAVGEALANAIEHSGSGDVIDIRCRVDCEKIVATIVDSGRGFAGATPAALELPCGLDERGRGIPIMRRCAEIFAVRSIPGRGTAVVLGHYVGDHATAAKDSFGLS